MTLFEILLAVVFLMTALVFLFNLFSTSSRDTLDAYHETVAYELAHEALEWVAGLGFGPLQRIRQNPGHKLFAMLGRGTFMPVCDQRLDDGTMLAYPEDFKRFERKVEMIDRTDRLLLVRVTVRSQLSGFRKGEVVLEKLVGFEDD